ncbi:MAG: extracellular solute-binding protein [Saccharofermentanales bacterium]
MKRVLSIFIVLAMLFAVVACGSSSDKKTDESEAKEEVKEKAEDSADKAEDSADKAEDSADKAEDSADKAEDSAESDGEVTISLWTWSPITRTAEKMIAAFEAENPNIKIEYTNYNYNPEYLAAISAAAASDNLPDIMGLQPGSLTQTYSNYLIDLNEYAAADWGDDWASVYDNVTQSQLQLGNVEGDESYYIMPIESQVILIEYNKTLFNQLGLEKPTTYDELVNAAQELRDNGYAPLFFGGADGWQHVNLLIMCTSQIDPELFDKAQNGEIPWTSDEMKQAMTNYQKLFDDGVIQDGSLSSTSYSDGTTLFLAGQAGMMALGSWWAQEYTGEDVSDAVANWDYDYFYLPAIEEGVSDSLPIGGMDFGYGITKNCENPEAAWKALASFAAGAGAQAIANDMNNHLSYPDIIPDKAQMPDRPGLDAAVDEFVRTGEDIAGGLVNQRIGNAEIETAVQTAMQGLIGGTYDVDQAAQYIQDVQDTLGD